MSIIPRNRGGHNISLQFNKIGTSHNTTFNVSSARHSIYLPNKIKKCLEIPKQIYWNV